MSVPDIFECLYHGSKSSHIPAAAIDHMLLQLYDVDFPFLTNAEQAASLPAPLVMSL